MGICRADLNLTPFYAKTEEHIYFFGKHFENLLWEIEMMEKGFLR